LRHAAAEADARELLGRLAVPPGALGGLGDMAVELAGIAGECPPPLPEPAVVAVFAGDHGVVAQGVTPWPSEVTAQMVATFCAGGATINALARQVGAQLVVVDVGVASELPPHPALLDRKVAPGTRDLSVGPAMTLDQARAAWTRGEEVARDLVAGGARLLVMGDMGIGNTTPSAALIAAYTGHPAAGCTGRGTGVDDATLARKTAVVAAAVERVAGAGPEEVLAEVGGLEIAALAGFAAAGVGARVPVLADGVITLAALLAAEAMAPGTRHGCIAGHRSAEPGASVALDHLGLGPLLDLDLRLGEGSGACLAVPLVQAAARVLREVATFDAAGVQDKRP
jgi:nicotinate-nucleotide--dimethylbenzimidazole phosphoribosyltransferase